MSVLSSLPRFILWSVRLALAVILFVLLALAGLIGWLSTEEGQSYVEGFVQEELSEATGYRITTDGLHFRWPLSVRIDSLALADAKGTWLEAAHVDLSVLPTATIQSHVILNEVAAQSLTLHRTPESTPSPESSAMASQDSAERESGAMDVSILDLAVAQLTIAKEITRLEQDAVSIVTGSLTWHGADEKLAFNANIDLSQGLPQVTSGKISAPGEYRLPVDQLHFSALSVVRPDAELTSSGMIDIASETLSLSVQSKPVELGAWTPDVRGAATLEAKIDGSFDFPAWDAMIHTQSVSASGYVLPDAAHHITGSLREDDLIEGQLTVKVDENRHAAVAYRWQDPLLKLHNMTVYDGANQVSGDITVNIETLLADGTLKAALPDLARLSLYLPEKVSGSANLTAAFSPDGQKQAASLTGDLRSLSAHNITASHVTIDAAIKDVATAKPDRVAVTVQGAGYGEVKLEKAALHATPDGESWNLSLKANGKAEHPFDIKTNGKVTARPDEAWHVLLSSLSGSYDTHTLQSVKPMTFTVAPDRLSLNAPAFNLNGGIFDIEATQTKKTIHARLNGQGIALAHYRPSLPENVRKAVATLALTVEGPLPSPRAAIDATVTGIRLHEQANNTRVSAAARIAQGHAEIEATLGDAPAMASSVQARVPVTFSMQPFIFSVDDARPLSGSGQLALDISALAGLFLPPDHILKGEANGAFQLSGSVSRPSVEGEIRFTDGSYRFLPLGLAFPAIEATVKAEDAHFALTEFIAKDSAGNRLRGHGDLRLNEPDGFSYQAEFQAEKLALLRHPNVRAVISGTVGAQGDQAQGVLSGELVSDLLEIHLPDRFAQSVPELHVVQTIPPSEETQSALLPQDSYPLLLDVKWEADNKVFVRGWGVDAELEGALALKGKLADPGIEGKLSTIRGRYEEFGKRFTLKKGELAFEGDMPPSPYMHIVATATESDTEIMPILSGPVLEPELTIESSPAMPEDEALSLLLFGKDPSKISAFQAAQLASSLAKLSGHGGGGFDPIGTVRNALGVDDIKVNSNGDDAADTTVGVGKYIGDNVYLEVERGAQTGSGKARVEVEVLPNISVESTTGAAGDSSVGVNWKYDY